MPIVAGIAEFFAIQAIGVGVCSVLKKARLLSTTNYVICFFVGYSTLMSVALLIGIPVVMAQSLILLGSLFLVLNIKCLAEEIMSSPREALIITTITGLLFIPMGFSPIHDWDALFRYFFRAKMLFVNESLDIFRAGILEVDVPDYPLGLSILSTLAPKALAAWNDVLPKSSLVCLWCAFICITRNIFESKSAGALIVAISAIWLGVPHLVNGYTDGWVTLFVGSCFCLFFKRTLCGLSGAETLLTIIAISLSLPTLKSDGNLYALVLILTSIIIHFCSSTAETRFDRKSITCILTIGAYCSLPILIWKILKQQHNVPPTWNPIGEEYLHAAITRVQSLSDLIIIYSKLIWLNQLDGLILFFISILFLSIFSKKLRNFEYFSFPLMACAAGWLFLFSVLLYIFLGTPKPLAWHLSTAAERVTLPLKAAFAGTILGAVLLRTTDEDKLQS